MTARSRPQGWMSLLSLATVLDTLAVGALVLGHATSASRIAAASLHLLAVVVVASASRASPSQRALLCALLLTLPILGAIVAAAALSTRGRGVVGEVPAREAPEPRPLSVSDIRQLTDGVSAWEALMSGNPAERSATVAMLAHKGDPGSIALLRKVVALGKADVAVEAAMALEELDRVHERAAGVGG